MECGKSANTRLVLAMVQGFQRALRDGHVLMHHHALRRGDGIAVIGGDTKLQQLHQQRPPAGRAGNCPVAERSGDLRRQRMAKPGLQRATRLEQRHRIGRLPCRLENGKSREAQRACLEIIQQAVIGKDPRISACQTVDHGRLAAGQREDRVGGQHLGRIPAVEQVTVMRHQMKALIGVEVVLKPDRRGKSAKQARRHTTAPFLGMEAVAGLALCKQQHMLVTSLVLAFEPQPCRRAIGPDEAEPHGNGQRVARRACRRFGDVLLHRQGDPTVIIQ